MGPDGLSFAYMKVHNFENLVFFHVLIDQRPEDHCLRGSLPPTVKERLKNTKGATWRTSENALNTKCELLQRYCPIGGLVLDDCGGTGTTNLACIRLGMDGYCIDIDKAITDDAAHRAKWYFYLPESGA